MTPTPFFTVRGQVSGSQVEGNGRGTHKIIILNGKRLYLLLSWKHTYLQVLPTSYNLKTWSYLSPAAYTQPRKSYCVQTFLILKFVSPELNSCWLAVYWLEILLPVIGDNLNLLF
jgi:hypothetical protein